eukprot:Opistho-2@78798
MFHASGYELRIVSSDPSIALISDRFENYFPAADAVLSLPSNPRETFRTHSQEATVTCLAEGIATFKIGSTLDDPRRTRPPGLSESADPLAPVEVTVVVSDSFASSPSVQFVPLGSRLCLQRNLINYTATAVVLVEARTATGEPADATFDIQFADEIEVRLASSRRVSFHRAGDGVPTSLIILPGALYDFESSGTIYFIPVNSGASNATATAPGVTSSVSFPIFKAPGLTYSFKVPAVFVGGSTTVDIRLDKLGLPYGYDTSCLMPTAVGGFVFGAGTLLDDATGEPVETGSRRVLIDSPMTGPHTFGVVKCVEKGTVRVSLGTAFGLPISSEFRADTLDCIDYFYLDAVPNSVTCKIGESVTVDLVIANRELQNAYFVDMRSTVSVAQAHGVIALTGRREFFTEAETLSYARQDERKDFLTFRCEAAGNAVIRLNTSFQFMLSDVNAPVDEITVTVIAAPYELPSIVLSPTEAVIQDFGYRGRPEDDVVVSISLDRAPSRPLSIRAVLPAAVVHSELKVVPGSAEAFLFTANDFNVSQTFRFRAQFVEGPWSSVIAFICSDSADSNAESSGVNVQPALMRTRIVQTPRVGMLSEDLDNVFKGPTCSAGGTIDIPIGFVTGNMYDDALTFETYTFSERITVESSTFELKKNVPSTYVAVNCIAMSLYDPFEIPTVNYYNTLRGISGRFMVTVVEEAPLAVNPQHVTCEEGDIRTVEVATPNMYPTLWLDGLDAHILEVTLGAPDAGVVEVSTPLVTWNPPAEPSNPFATITFKCLRKGPAVLAIRDHPSMLVAGKRTGLHFNAASLTVDVMSRMPCKRMPCVEGTNCVETDVATSESGFLCLTPTEMYKYGMGKWKATFNAWNTGDDCRKN